MKHSVKAIVGAATIAVAFTFAPTAAPAQSAPVLTSVQTVVTTSVSAPSVKIKKYKNCKALNKVFKHGVGKKGAKDKTKGKKVTNFYKNTKLYNKNRHLDRDRDGIACEKR